MSKRLILWLLAAILLLSLAPAVSAQEQAFPSIHATVNLPDGVYQTVLTPDNLPDNEAFITAQGGTLSAWQADFAARGILLQAYDPDNSRVLVISALADVDGQQLFDINEHTPEVRARYRVSHGAKGAYAVLGYRYDGFSWRNFPKIGRFLQLRYSYRQGGEVVHRGFQRRTVRNGYTITVDLQVHGRQLTARDNTAMNKVFDTFRFTQILPLPPLPISLDETATAPVETAKSSFIMKGKTKPEASLTAALISFSGNTTTLFETKANKAGNYSLPIQLPGEDVYLMTLTVQSPGFDDLSRSYNIHYQQGLISAQVSAVPAELPGDTFTLTGQTSETGVRVSLSVNGKESAKNVARDGSFSFPIDTSVEGAYSIRLVLSKKGLQDRVFTYTANRVLSQAAREQVLKQSALQPAYAELAANPNSFDGRLLSFAGTLTDKQNLTDTWVLRLATNKVDNSFTDFIVLTSDTDPGFPVGSEVTAYGQMTGLNISQQEDGSEESLPKLNLSLMTAR